MGCFSAEKPKTGQMPSWIKTPSKQISRGVQSELGQAFTPYTGERVAGLSDTQTDAMAWFEQMFGPGGTDTGTPRLIDDIPGTGPLAGSIADYMDPYLASVLGPALRELGIANTGAHQAADARRHMSGAYGDTGAAIEGGELQKEYLQAVGDTTGKISSDAFRTAMGLRGDDINRLMSGRNQTADLLKTMFNMGGVEQSTEQRGLDADFEEFMRMIGYDWDKLAKAASITGSLPMGSTTPGAPSTASSLLGAAGSIASFFV